MKNAFRKTVIFFVLISILLLFGCGETASADEMLSEFIYAYGAEGVIYSSEAKEGEAGYVRDGLTEKIYVYEGNFPQEFAIYLNSHTDSASECGVFVCDDADEKERVTDMCEKRIDLLGTENALILRSGNVVFYSTMTDKARTSEIWKKIIRAHT